MALTGKTIGQLTYLQYPTNDTLIPVELSGDTYHIAFSAVNYTETTYTDLLAGATAGELTPGQYYLMTDYQTCYDRPNYDNIGNPITTGNYATGTTEPLILLAISTSAFSPTVYSTINTLDKITYDISFNQTEVTNGPAKGRITERIDNRNNRADYDFREVQFIRYDGYYCENKYDGTLSIDGSGNVTGTNTFFTVNFSPGSILAVNDTNAPFASFMFYEVLTIGTDTSMTVSGQTIFAASNRIYGLGSGRGTTFPYQSNVSSYNSSSLYYTFDDISNSNNYLGSNIEYNTFILSNNVFKSGTYTNNTFGGNVCNNTFDDDMDSNTCGPFFQFNVIINDFDKNTIGSYFERNIIEPDFWFNTIGNNFQYNMIGDNDGYDFEYNHIGEQFNYNFFSFANGDFRNNSIDNNFSQNYVSDSFRDNNIKGNFTGCYIDSNFDDNSLMYGFTNNTTRSSFTNNTFGENCYGNSFYAGFQYNTIGSSFGNNIIGDVNNPGFNSFRNNSLGSNFEANNFTGDTQFNTIGSYCNNNTISTNFSYNQIGSTFQYNTIANDFGFGGGEARGNIVGNWFQNNTVGEYCYDNTFADNCTNNIISDNCINNKISFGMNNTTINDPVGLNGFRNNTITYGFFSQDLTTSGGGGGNPVFYVTIPTTVTLDYLDANGYVTFLSGGTIIAQTITV